MNKAVGLYFAIDTSASMKNTYEGQRRIDMALGLPLVCLDLYEKQNSLISNLLVGVTGFNTSATVYLPLGEITNLRSVPFDIEPQNDTHYGVAFTSLRNQIEEDFKHLAAQGVLMKPAVILLTDGRPNDNITSRNLAFQSLREISLQAEGREYVLAPQVISAGIDAVKQEILERYASKKEYAIKAMESLNMSAQLSQVMSLIANSVSRSMSKLGTQTDDADPIDLQLPQEKDFIW
jgi:uncharacterized protein YegL